MTYPELKLALDIGDPETVLLNLAPRQCAGKYYVVCDDGDVYCFDKDGKEHKIDNIPDACFIRDYFLKKIIIPDTVKSIGKYAFENCDLTSVTISDSVTHIGYHAFYNCWWLTDVVIPNNVTIIDDYAFYGCFRLMDVMIGNGVTNIGQYAFEFCSSLIDMTIPSSIKHIEKDAFCGCTKLERILFKGKTIEQVRAMDNYPWGIKDESIFQASN